MSTIRQFKDVGVRYCGDPASLLVNPSEPFQGECGACV